ncbi:MAG: hypothetical protein LBM19_02605 [Holosporales bacterium]|jgi:hypothetical protein|nr:hypothetical protein [Holosporales bacterium]
MLGQKIFGIVLLGIPMVGNSICCGGTAEKTDLNTLEQQIRAKSPILADGIKAIAEFRDNFIAGTTPAGKGITTSAFVQEVERTEIKDELTRSFIETEMEWIRRRASTFNTASWKFLSGGQGAAAIRCAQKSIEWINERGQAMLEIALKNPELTELKQALLTMYDSAIENEDIKVREFKHDNIDAALRVVYETEDLETALQKLEETFANDAGY